MGDRGVLMVLMGVVGLYILLIPFSKVEESFNTQAVRDVLKLGLKRELYDHRQFPGVVPRTFLGALVVAGLTCPLFYVCTSWLQMTDLVGLYISRAVLGLLSVMSVGCLQEAVRKTYGATVGRLFVVLTVAQFHLPFYISRLLPNTLAMVITNVAVAHWIERPKSKRIVYFLVFAMICFRCDVLLLLAPIFLHLLIARHLHVLELFLHGSMAVVGSLAITVLVDSWFWGRWLWPEGEVYYFNAILQKSVEWGAMPFHWYLTSALPRSLLVALPLSCWAPFLDRRLIRVAAVSWIYVILFSKLSHKEVRFLFPVLPLFNVAAAVTFARFIRNRTRSWMSGCIYAGCLLGCILSFFATMVMLTASVQNYPGGKAIHDLHIHNHFSNFFRQHECRGRTNITVHIGRLPASTGISRFAELDSCWSYSKTENLTSDVLSKLNFTYLLTEDSHFPGYHLVKGVEGFDRLEFSFPWLLHFRTKPMVHILEQNVG